MRSAIQWGIAVCVIALALVLIAVVPYTFNKEEKAVAPIPNRYDIEGIGIVQEFTLSDNTLCVMVQRSASSAMHITCTCR